MTADLHLLPLHRRDGEDTTDPLPGLFLAAPPRKAVRSRQSDQLLLHLTFTGTATLNTESQTQLLQGLAETYYQTSGAATSALRALAESLNTTLLNRNLRAEGKGLQAIGLLTVLILRSDQILVGQSGPTHVYAVEAAQYRHLHDPQTSGHGLGLGRTAGLLTNYIPNQPGTLILLSPAPPPAWNNPALQTAHGRPLRTVQRGLLKPAGPDLNALLIQVQAGTGKIHLHKTPPAEPMAGERPSGQPAIAGETVHAHETTPPAESTSEPEDAQPEPDEGIAVQPESEPGDESPLHETLETDAESAVQRVGESKSPHSPPVNEPTDQQTPPSPSVTQPAKRSGSWGIPSVHSSPASFLETNCLLSPVRPWPSSPSRSPFYW